MNRTTTPSQVTSDTTSRDRTFGTQLAWPDTGADHRPHDHPYRAALWLLGRYPRLARLAGRISGLVVVDENGEPTIDLDHLGNVFAAGPAYAEAWSEYEQCHRPPEDDEAYYRWHADGPQADDFAPGLSDLGVMSSGEVASLRLLATLGTTQIPFKLGDLHSLDAEGQRLLSDWCRVVLTG